ncbi:MAG: InlB B-repeat-containing protein [Treponema sp.]|nr:InlB B-repeat-containing protein [Treponema sp.]
MKKLLLTSLACFSLVLSGMLISCDSPSNTQPILLPATPETTTPTTTPATETPAAQPVVSYTVSFVTDGGTDVASQTVTSGNKATRPANPSKTGCTFAGWYTNNTFTTAFDFDTAITANTVLYAKWDIAEGYYKVTFNANGGTLSTATWIAVQSGTTLTAPSDPTKENAIFGGWYTDAECTSAFAFPHTITQAVTLYAKWIPAGNINLNLEDVTMSTTANPGCYTFTISPALHAQYQLALVQALGNTNFTITYGFDVYGQGLNYLSSNSNRYNSTSTTYILKQSLIKDANYRLRIQVKASIPNNTTTVIDTIYFDFKG